MGIIPCSTPGGNISADGQTGHEPGLIMINYGTNDGLHHSNPDDTFASIVRSLAALRKSSPSAQIIVIIPFGQYFASELKKAVEIHKKAHPKDKKIAIIDLGQAVAATLAEKNHLMGGLHPNERGHANFRGSYHPTNDKYPSSELKRKIALIKIYFCKYFAVLLLLYITQVQSTEIFAMIIQLLLIIYNPYCYEYVKN